MDPAGANRSVQTHHKRITIGVFFKTIIIMTVTMIISLCIWRFLIVPLLPEKIRKFIEEVFELRERPKRNPRKEELIQLFKKARYRCRKQIGKLRHSIRYLTRSPNTEAAARSAVRDLEHHKLYIKQLMEELEQIDVLEASSYDTESRREFERIYTETERTIRIATDTIIRLQVYFFDVGHRVYL